MPKKLPLSASLSEQLLNSIKHEGPHAEALLEGGMRGFKLLIPEFEAYITKRAERYNIFPLGPDRPPPLPPPIQNHIEASDTM